MKKIFFTCLFIAVTAVSSMEPGIDEKVKAAVDDLAAFFTAPIEVSIGGIFIGETKTSSALSLFLINRILTHAHSAGKFKVVERKRGIAKAGSPKAIITGEFMQSGKTVHVTLRVVGDSDERVLVSKDFTISAAELKKEGYDVLPPNIKSVKEIKKKEDIFIPATPIDASSNVAPLKIEAWPDSISNTYFAGDQMTINLLAAQNCYVKVYRIDAQNKMRLLFPNQTDRDNFLKANTVSAVPKSPVSIAAKKSFGMEHIFVQASTEQFANIEKEFTEIKNAARNTINETRNGVGAGLEGAVPGKKIMTAETYFSITILDVADFSESYSYPKPENMTEAVESARAEIAGQGGAFNGNEREGSFRTSEIDGSYRVGRNTVIVSLQNLRRTDIHRVMSAPAAGYVFSIDKPKNIPQAIQTVKRRIERRGGFFNGNEEEGMFKASGIAGRYSVSNQVTVSITEKPVVIPYVLIEYEIKKYFKGK